MPVSGMRVTQASITQTRRAIKNLESKVGIAAAKRGARKAGMEGIKQLRRAAPKGLTGQFRRSLDVKLVDYKRDRNFIAVLGQRGRRRAFTAKQVASANKRTGRLSKGLSGIGWSPAIWWIESGTKAHEIKARKSKLMYWNVAKGRQRFSPPQFARRVRHPGHRGTGFMASNRAALQAMGVKVIDREIESAMRSLLRTATP